MKLQYPGLGQLLHEARLATGDTAAMKTEYRQALESAAPAGAVTAETVKTLVRLCEVLVVEGKDAEARQALANWEIGLPLEQRSAEGVGEVRQMILYVLGDLDAIREIARTQAGGGESDTQLHALLAAGRPKDVVQQAALGKRLENPWGALATSLSFELSGDRPEADKWRQKACAGLERLDANSKHAADLLRRPKAPQLSELDGVVLAANQKSLIAAVLAVRFPERRGRVCQPGSPAERQPHAAVPVGAKGTQRRPLRLCQRISCPHCRLSLRESTSLGEQKATVIVLSPERAEPEPEWVDYTLRGWKWRKPSPCRHGL